VKTARAKFSALVVALVVATGAPAFAALDRPACPTAAQHHCGKVASVKPCCCMDRSGASNQGPVESRIRPHSDLPIAGAVTALSNLPMPSPSNLRPHTAPQRAGPLDLPTLFANLLI
jgi:hypothetical protein